MASLVRAANAHSLYWIVTDKGERVGRVWGLDGFWRWSVAGADSRDAASFEAAQASALNAADRLNASINAPMIAA